MRQANVCSHMSGKHALPGFPITLPQGSRIGTAGANGRTGMGFA